MPPFNNKNAHITLMAICNESIDLRRKEMEKAVKKYWPIFVLPTVAAFAIGFIYPFIQGVYLSFCKFSTIKKAKFVGLANYQYALTDESFYHSFGYTLAFAVVSVVLINVIAFMLALALTSKIKGKDIYRTVFFMPNLIGGIVLGYIWKTLLDCFLSLIGQPLLALNETWGFVGLVILMCWQQVGYMMIIYIAGFQGIPNHLYEAARIDGASKPQILKSITIPMMAPSITICTFLTLTNSFKLFDQNLALTNGLPGVVDSTGTTVYKTQMLALNIYQTFYQNANTRGVGQAKAVIFFVIVAFIA